MTALEVGPRKMLIGALDLLLNDDNLEQIKDRVLRKSGVNYNEGAKRKNIRDGKDYYVRARLRQFSVDGLHEYDFLKICLAVSLMTERPDLFEMNFAFAAVQYRWKTSLWIHLFSCFIYAIYIVLVFALNISIHGTNNINSGDLTIISFIIVFSCGFVIFEIVQVVSNLRNYYIFQYWTDYLVGWIAYSLTLVGCGLRLSYGMETKTSADVMAVATVFVFLKGLDLLRPFESTGPTIRIVYAILFQIIPLLFILLVIDVGFSQAFYLLSYKNPSLDSHGAGLSILFTYIYMMGPANWSEMFNTTTPALAIILLCIYIALTSILILSLIIAKMNNIYSMVLGNAMGEWKREQCKLIIEYSIFTKIFEIPNGIKKYLTILMREEYVEKRKGEYLQRNCTNLILKDVRDMKKNWVERQRGNSERFP